MQSDFKSYNELLNSNEVYSKVETTFLFDKLAEDNSVDAVLTFRNVHNWINNNDENAKKIFELSFQEDLVVTLELLSTEQKKKLL